MGMERKDNTGKKAARSSASAHFECACGLPLRVHSAGGGAQEDVMCPDCGREYVVMLVVEKVLK